MSVGCSRDLHPWPRLHEIGQHCSALEIRQRGRGLAVDVEVVEREERHRRPGGELRGRTLRVPSPLQPSERRSALLVEGVDLTVDDAVVVAERPRERFGEFGEGVGGLVGRCGCAGGPDRRQRGRSRAVGPISTRGPTPGRSGPRRGWPASVWVPPARRAYTRVCAPPPCRIRVFVERIGVELRPIGGRRAGTPAGQSVGGFWPAPAGLGLSRSAYIAWIRLRDLRVLDVDRLAPPEVPTGK